MRGELDEALRVEGSRVLATLIRYLGDIDVAEDALQDAVVIALARWRTEPPPDNIAAWLHTTARHRAIDRIRREAKRADKERRAVQELALDQAADELRADDPLRLFFLCCHPALSPSSRIALCLRTLGRLSTAEISSVLLSNGAAVTRRITRAKTKIREARIPYQLPTADELPARLDSVLAVIYAIYATGYHAPVGDVGERFDLAREAIRYARMLVDLLPDEPETAGLLALLLATDARAGTRVDAAGRFVPFPEQDRSRWDHDQVSEASALLHDAMAAGRPGQYQLQAAIACLHGEAATYAATDWPQIVYLYRLLERKAATPVVRVNRAVAEAELFGPQKGLDLLEDVSGVEHWHSYWAAKGRFLQRMGRRAPALEAYQRALELPLNAQERSALTDIIAALEA